MVDSASPRRVRRPGRRESRRVISSFACTYYQQRAAIRAAARRPGANDALANAGMDVAIPDAAALPPHRRGV